MPKHTGTLVGQMLILNILDNHPGGLRFNELQDIILLAHGKDPGQLDDHLNAIGFGDPGRTPRKAGRGYYCVYFHHNDNPQGWLARGLWTKVYTEENGKTVGRWVITPKGKENLTMCK